MTWPVSRRLVLAMPVAALAGRSRRERPVGWNNSIFQLLLVVSGPNKTGLFVYNGAPAKGSLVAALVAPGVTSDPFGNSVSAVVNFGKWNASGTLLEHFGVNADGDTFLANASGLVVQHAHSLDGSTWYYSTAGEGAGNLRESIAPAAGTDAAGNSYLTGIASYPPAAGQPAAQLASATLQFRTIATPPNITPSVSGAAASATGTNLAFESGKGTAGATDCNMQMLDSLQDAANGGTGVPQVVVNSGPSANPLTSALLEVQGSITSTLLRAIVSGAAETWHAASLAAGFAAGGTTPRFRLEPTGITAGTVRLDGAVNLTATEAANTTMFTLPAGYLPASAHDYVTKSTLSGLNPGAGVMPATVHVTTSGQVQIAVNGINGNFVVLDGITIPLD